MIPMITQPGETYTLKNQDGAVIGFIWLEERTITSQGISEAWGWKIDYLDMSGKDFTLIQAIEKTIFVTGNINVIELDNRYNFGELKES